MPVLTQIPRGASPLFQGPEPAEEAEIKPVEPDQGNACAGKEVHFIFPLFSFRSISDSIFNCKK
jgi:hypothetical protein